jgi:hypothetical protein
VFPSDTYNCIRTMTQTLKVRGMGLSMIMVVLAIMAVSSSSPLTSDNNALRLAELEDELGSPTSLVELSQTQLSSIDTSKVIENHIRQEDQDEAKELENENIFKDLSEEEQMSMVDASLAEVESAISEGRGVNGESNILLQTTSSAEGYWDNAWNRRFWCNRVRFGYWWIERNSHWQNVCRGIEKFRPWGWWSHFCHNISQGSWGRWYRHNHWWKRHCDSIRNPHYVLFNIYSSPVLNLYTIWL